MQNLVTPRTDIETAHLCEKAVAFIREYEHKTLKNVIAIGKTLISVKAALKDDGKHGRFLVWLKDEVRWSFRTAQNYMAAAEAFSQEYATVAQIPLKKVYDIAYLPESDRSDILVLITDPQNPPLAKINEQLTMLRARRQAAKKSAAGKETSGTCVANVAPLKDVAEKQTATPNAQVKARKAFSVKIEGVLGLLKPEQVRELAASAKKLSAQNLGMAMQELLAQAADRCGTNNLSVVICPPSANDDTAPSVEVEDAVIIQDKPVLTDLDLSAADTAA